MEKGVDVSCLLDEKTYCGYKWFHKKRVGRNGGKLTSSAARKWAGHCFAELWKLGKKEEKRRVNGTPQGENGEGFNSAPSGVHYCVARGAR